jgi:hypothetical protein
MTKLPESFNFMAYFTYSQIFKIKCMVAPILRGKNNYLPIIYMTKHDNGAGGGRILSSPNSNP